MGKKGIKSIDPFYRGPRRAEPERNDPPGFAAARVARTEARRKRDAAVIAARARETAEAERAGA